MKLTSCPSPCLTNHSSLELLISYARTTAMAGAGYKLCGPRAARRYLILVNMVIAFAGMLYIVVGAISLAHGALPPTLPRARYTEPN
jgi:hypothetical protein